MALVREFLPDGSNTALEWEFVKVSDVHLSVFAYSWRFTNLIKKNLNVNELYLKESTLRVEPEMQTVPNSG